MPGRLGPFVGLDNWLRITTDPIFIQAAGQTLMYVIPSAVLGVVISAVALVLNERFPVALARASLLIPWALPPVVVAAMFQWFLDSRRGLLGEWLVNAGLVDQPPLFLSGVPGTLYMLTAIHIWKTFSLIALIFLVALQYLPEETISARIDGAGRWQRVPPRRPAIPASDLIAAVIIQVLITIQLFDLIFALTGWHPRYSTYNLYFYTFKTTFEQTDFGYGAVRISSPPSSSCSLCLTRGRARGLLS